MKTVAYFTNIAPHYRDRLWNILVKDPEIEFYFFFGSSSSIKQIDFSSEEWVPHKSRLRSIKNHRVKGITIWQSGVLKNIMRQQWRSVVFLGDMFILSTWVAAIILRLKGVPVIFWSHGLYGNEFNIKKRLRILFFRIANKHMLYGNYSRKKMVEAGFKPKDLFTIYNSLDYDEHLKQRTASINGSYYESRNFFTNKHLPTLIFIGRLTPQKRLSYLIDAVLKINNNTPRVNLMIVGDGPEMKSLQKKATAHNGTIYFYGALYNETEIGKLLANATLCVSPGNIGLTAIHALSFGTPICTHDNMKEQMPEVEAIKEGETGIFFNTKLNNLSSAILNWIDQNKDRQSIREECFRIIDEKYNPYYQLKMIKKVIKEASSEDSPN